jgi:hypothetical protein
MMMVVTSHQYGRKIVAGQPLIQNRRQLSGINRYAFLRILGKSLPHNEIVGICGHSAWFWACVAAGRPAG